MDFLSESDLSQIAADCNKVIHGPSSQSVRLVYYTWADESSDQVIPPSLENNREINPNLIEERFDARQVLITPREIEKFQFRNAVSGDCMFLFDTDVNLDEPAQGFPVANKTLRIINHFDQQWIPSLEVLHEDEMHLKAYLGETIPYQAILARLSDATS